MSPGRIISLGDNLAIFTHAVNMCAQAFIKTQARANEEWKKQNHPPRKVMGEAGEPWPGGGGDKETNRDDRQNPRWTRPGSVSRASLVPYHSSNAKRVAHSSELALDRPQAL